ncbi:unnamed protein product [Calypogeia fissa]
MTSARSLIFTLLCEVMKGTLKRLKPDKQSSALLNFGFVEIFNVRDEELLLGLVFQNEARSLAKKYIQIWNLD